MSYERAIYDEYNTLYNIIYDKRIWTICECACFEDFNLLWLTPFKKSGYCDNAYTRNIEVNAWVFLGNHGEMSLHATKKVNNVHVVTRKHYLKNLLKHYVISWKFDRNDSGRSTDSRQWSGTNGRMRYANVSKVVNEVYRVSFISKAFDRTNNR